MAERSRQFPWRWLGLLVILIAIVQALAPFTDHQVANMSTGALGLLGVILGVVSCVRRARSWRNAAKILGAVAAILLLLGIVFRFEGFSGELRPQFAFRFRQIPRLPEPEPAKSATNSPPIGDMSATQDELGSGMGTTGDDFPEFLGPGRRAYLPERKFDMDWHREVPQILWKQPIGAGWSGFAIVGERIVTMEQRNEEEWVTCYHLADGRLLWKHGTPGKHQHLLGGTGPRGTPTIVQGKVVALSAEGKLTCLELETGSLLWQQDLFILAGLTQQTAEQSVTWGRSASPLVVDDLVVVPLGGLENSSVSLIAFRLLSGEEVWRAGNAQISYASPQLVELKGGRQIVSVNEDNVSGHAVGCGKKLWEYPWPGKSNGGANCSQPLPYQSDKLLLGKGYGGGGTLIRIVEADGVFAAERQWQRNKLLKTKFTNTVIVGDYGYALSDGTLECVDLREGIATWKQDRSHRYGHGQILGVEDVLLVLSESGEVAMVALDPSEYRELAKIPILSGTTWNTLAISGRKLVVRNSQEAACVELPKRKGKSLGTQAEP